ncbi:MAG: hypothetical protein QOH88_3562 [Verrucomicrobiota bacterium]|jgi:hypothetical protein
MKSRPGLRSRVVVAAALLLAAREVARGQTIADLPDDKFQSLVTKTELYGQALKAAHGIKKSYDSYASWVDVKTGPTGKEKLIDNGVSDFAPNILPDIQDASKKGPGMWPPLPIDAGMQKLADTTMALAPLVKSASEYYAQKAYKTDAAKRGQELHVQMMPLFDQVFAAQIAFRRGFRAVKEDVDRRVLAQLEKDHGKNYEWHLRSFLMAAETLGDMMPTHLDAPPIDAARYRQRFVALDAAFTAFTQYRTAHAEEIKTSALAGSVGNSVDDFFAASKQLRSLLDAPKPDRQLYLAKVSDFTTKFDDLLQRSTVASK